MQQYDTRHMSEAQIREAFIKCFSSREGRIVLSYLKRLTQERYLGPESSSDALRHLEGQRHLVSIIQNKISDDN